MRENSSADLVKSKILGEKIIEIFVADPKARFDPGLGEETAKNLKEGFLLHRVVLIEITDSEVIFHDPNEASSGAYRHETLEHFRTVFEGVDGPELARYSLEP